MSEMRINRLMQIIAGAVGGNVAAAAGGKNVDLGAAAIIGAIRNTAAA